MKNKLQNEQGAEEDEAHSSQEVSTMFIICFNVDL